MKNIALFCSKIVVFVKNSICNEIKKNIKHFFVDILYIQLLTVLIDKQSFIIKYKDYK